MRERHALRRGFTLIEATISLVIVSLVAVAGLSAVSVARKSRISINDMILARMYADAVMAEIQGKRYRDAVEPGNPLGPDSSDDVLGIWERRADDVDDYDGHTITPVSDVNMRPLSDGQWGAGIAVSWVDASEPTKLVSEESGVKRITIAIFKGDKIILRASTLRTLGADQIKAVVTP